MSVQKIKTDSQLREVTDFVQSGRGKLSLIVLEFCIVCRLHTPHDIMSFNTPWKTWGKEEYWSGMRSLFLQPTE